MNSADGKNVEVSTASRRAYDAIELAIQIGELKPNQRLIERELVENLGISRTPIREALRQLEKVGLIDVIPNRGAIVRDATISEIIDIYAVRLTLERLALDLLPLPSPETLAALEHNQQGLADAARRRDYPTMVRLNDKFHELLVEPSGNAFLAEQLRQLRRRNYLIRHISPLETFTEQHGAIVERLRRADWAGLVPLVLAHIFEPARLYLSQSLPASEADLAGLHRLEHLVVALSQRSRPEPVEAPQF